MDEHRRSYARIPAYMTVPEGDPTGAAQLYHETQQMVLRIYHTQSDFHRLRFLFGLREYVRARYDQMPPVSDVPTDPTVSSFGKPT